MKRAKVSALREGGLHRVCGAEPQVSEVINSTKGKADTMKTYILRPFPPVERQTRRARPARAVRPKVQPPGALSGPALFTGLDVHSDSIAVGLAPSTSTEVRPYGVIGGTHDDVLKLLKKLSAAHPGYQKEKVSVPVIGNFTVAKWQALQIVGTDTFLRVGCGRCVGAAQGVRTGSDSFRGSTAKCQ
jgi:hypothetical protein